MAAFSTAAAVIGSAALGAASASAQSKAAKKAANAQVAAADEATALQRDTANYAISQSAPLSRTQAEARARQMLMSGMPPAQVEQYLQEAYAASYQALPDSSAGGGQPSRLRDGYYDGEGQWVEGVGQPNGAAPAYDTSWVRNWNAADEIKQQPGYQFQFDTGQKTLERSRAARGDWMSGDTGMALTQYGQDFASNYWDKMWDQYGDLWGGGSGSDESSQVAINFGNNAADNTIRSGNARASGYEQAGNAMSNFWQGAAGIPMYGAGQGWWGKG